MFIVYFLLWTLILYWIHRLGHRIPLIRFYHRDHHQTITNSVKNNDPIKWHWSNLFLFNDTKNSTIDLWLTEVIPTLAFSFITGQWWISIFYYVWAAFIQETIEHNQNFDWPILLSGRRHMIHHKNYRKNFGLFTSIWDRVFGTYAKL